jgi:hypothetical protein
MTYVINPVVTIGSVDYTDKVLNGVTATAGRTNIDEQPRSGFATISIVDVDTNIVPIEVDDKIVIKVDDSNGNEVIVWSGWVSDVVKGIRNSGQSGYLTETRVTGIGSLAKLNRRRVGANGYSKEFDGDRVYNIIFETAGITWADVSPTLTWNGVDPLLSWGTFDILIGTIDRPGDFELTNYNDGEANGLGLAQKMADSGLGILFEDAEGKINYSSFTRRLDDVALNGFTELDLGTIIATQLTSTSRLSDLANNVEIIYKNGQNEIGVDAASTALYGEWDVRVETELEKQLDAEQRVDYYLATRSFPRTSLTSITLLLSAGTITDTLRDDLIGLTISKPISIANLPPNIYDAPFTGFVEGYTYTIARNELFLSLNVSDYALSQIEMNWLQVPATETWNSITPTLEWANARSVN